MALPRKGTMAAQLAEPQFDLVTDVRQMSDGNFLRHCRERHILLRFATRHEHEQEHRLQPPKDHTHTNLEDQKEDGETTVRVSRKNARQKTE